ncbi:MAG: hypothetical protein IJX55_09845 [Clostridia bacterium]|nr:hypothetical protein [Clostridia bacterium]
MKRINPAVSAIVKLLVSTAIVFLLFYIFLPPLNPCSTEFWIFLTAVLAIYLIPFGLTKLFKVYSLPGSATRVEFSPQTRTVKYKIMVAVVALPIAVIVVGGIFSSTFFNAKKYAGVISVTEADFATDMPETNSVTNIALMDTDSAVTIGNRALGSLSDVVSQYVSSGEYTQINYQGTPQKLSNLEYDGFFKWLGNRANGIPGYVMVDPVNNTAEYKKLAAPLKYVESGYFGDDLMRTLRFNYPTKIFGTIAFEIDEAGTPYFIVSCMSPKVGLFGAYDVSEVIIFNPADGTHTKVPVGEVPQWIDIVYDGYLAEDKYNWHGLLSGGFWNSVIGNKGCKQTTDDFGYLMYDDDVWYYTGVTSVTADASNIGFIVSNARTGEYKYYSVVGAEEYSAMNAAEGEVQEKGYEASFPALINVSGEATYIMVLKDASGLVKLYALVNVEHYSIVATGETQAAAMAAYKKLLSQNGIAGGGASADTTTDVTVKEIEKLVIDGNSFFYFLCSDGNYYRVSVAEDESVLFIREGDALTVTYAETGTAGIRNILEWTETVPASPEN